MSYILGALKKAEKERNGEVAQQSDWSSQDWNAIEDRSSVGWGLKAAAVLVVVLLIAIFLLLWILIGNQSSESVTAGHVYQGAELELYVGEASVSTRLNENVFYQETELESVQQIRSSHVLQADAPVNNLAEQPAEKPPVFPNITGHLYFPENTSLSRIFSDTGSFREGHVFEDGLRLVSISESQAVFERHGENYEISLGGY